jgi:hypothetical protein
MPKNNKKAQVTIFIIIAIILVAGIVSYFLLKDKLKVTGIPASFQPVENYFLDCIKEKTEYGKEMLGERAGYIYLPDFEEGSSFAPFSNMFDFNGQAVPYWMYLSSSGNVKEQIPSKADMQSQLKKYIESEISNCDFSSFTSQGFNINMNDMAATVTINDLSIDVQVDGSLNIAKDNESFSQSTHKIAIDTKLGKMYNEAISIYNNEKQKAFLEAYAVDVLRLYAPVDGVELSCSPKIWMPQKVVQDLDNALEANINAIRTKSDYYTQNSKQEYFILKDLETSDAVNFLYSKNWPRKVEIWPTEGNMMIAQPVGNQEGLGILGFCYVPYHFVYDLKFPVLAQVYDESEIFQFPVSVIIDKNVARKAVDGEALNQEVPLCDYKNTEMTVNTYDSNLEGVPASISYKCFDTECSIGNTELVSSDASLTALFPQCVNGFAIARADGFAEKKYMFSSNQEGVVDIILSKLYNLSLDIEIDGKKLDENLNAIIYFKGGEYSASAVWPEQKQVQLIEDSYNITLQIYRNSSMIFPASTERKCVNTPKPGLLGMFGQTQEQCFEVAMPQQEVTSVLVGGGKTSDYLTEDRLKDGKLTISSELFSIPQNFNDIAKNYEQLSIKPIYTS